MTTDIKPSAATSDTHTPGPWQVRRTNSATEIYSGETPIAELWLRLNTPANARRIVACVNACEGISTDGLESAGLGGLHHIAEATFEQRMTRNQIEEQRDELLDNLRVILPMAKAHAARHPVGSNEVYCQEAATALAKARGQL